MDQMDQVDQVDQEAATQVVAEREFSGPRERLARLGAAALSDGELVAVLLGTGTRGRPVRELAEALLEQHGGLRRLVSQEAHELAAIPGLGPARAASVLAAVELGRRAQRMVEQRPVLRTPEQIYRYLVPELAARRREQFRILCVNARNQLLHDVRIEGTVSECPVDPREIFSAALTVRASGLILAHNHPTGDPTPSRQDYALTRQIAQASKLLRLRLLDHLIIGDDGFFSMAAEGTLPEQADLELECLNDRTERRTAR